MARRSGLLLGFLSCLLLPFGAARPEGAPGGAAPPAAITVAKWLALDPTDGGGRRPFNPSVPLFRYLLDRGAAPPAAGEVVAGSRGEKAWRAIEAKADGTVEDATGAWFYGEIERPAEGAPAVFLATLDGASAFFVNGAAFPGDVYRSGYGPVPVALAPGVNRIFVVGPRGSFRLLFTPWTGGRFAVLPQDATFPDFVEGEPPADLAAFRVIHASLDWGGESGWPDLEIRSGAVTTVVGGGVLPPPPLATEKRLGQFSDPVPTAGSGPRDFEVRAGRSGAAVPFRADVRKPGEARRVTFRSAIDGSVQYFGYLPAAPGGRKGADVATVLSLHGAGVDALGQARSYSPRPDFRIVAPTNRRPFGFDWQDFGRLDAYETLDRAQRRFGEGSARTFLTGHSMGGHGTWHLAVNDPDRWTAIAPSAGWCSFDTYAGGPRPATPLSAWWGGCDGGSRTEDRIGNLVPLPVFIVHGKADDNVPFSEAEGMLARLRAAGANPGTLFVDGMGHWWDGDAAPGADCVDHPAIFSFFRGTPAPVDPLSLDFVTVDPSIDAEHFWVAVEQPLEYGKPSRVRGAFAEGRAALTTENVRSLVVRGPRGAGLLDLTVDGQTLRPPEAAVRARAVRDGAAWRLESGLPAGEKGPGFSGPFKRAFDRGFVLVVGTKGAPEENREMLEVARYHSGQWWYRANGTAQIVRDTDVLGNPSLFAKRNLVLYGNADVNAAWATVFPGDLPVAVRRGAIRVGAREFAGDRLGAVFLYPRADAPGFLAGAFASTGPAGTRLAYGLPVFVSGVGYPDYAVFCDDFLCTGDRGVLATGWFDQRWRLQPGGFALGSTGAEGR